MRVAALVGLLLVAVSLPAHAARQAHGFEFAESIELGAGVVVGLHDLRETQRRFLPWQVLAFYARSSPEQEDELRLGLQPFAIEIVWLQDQPAEVVQQWWQQACDRAEPDPSMRAPLQSRIERLKGLFEDGVAHGQRTRISYQPDAGLRLWHAGSEPVALVGLDFVRLLVAIALDAGPPRGRAANAARHNP